MIWLMLSTALALHPGTVSGEWKKLAPLLREHAVIKPELVSEDFAAIAAGEVVQKRWARGEGVDGVLGAKFTTRPRDALWVAIQDDQHDKLAKGLTEVHVPGSSDARELLYQRLSLPWPLSARQWVIALENNLKLWQATSGAAWERSWTLADPKTAPTSDPKAEWTPVNEGNWMLVSIENGTLMIYTVRADVGGVVPGEAVVRWAMSTLEGMLQHVEERSAVVPAHYDKAHDPFYRPDGSPIPPGSL
jgi:hypothetical protein